MWKNILHRLKKQAGMTIVEMVLYVVSSGILMGVTSEVLLSHIDTYQFMSQNQSTEADVRYALNRISSDLMKLAHDNVSQLSDNSITFVDTDNVVTDYGTGSSNGKTALLRGNEPLLTSVASFQIKGFDMNGQITTNISNIRRYTVTVKTQPSGNEGAITLSTTVTPREYIYASYQ